MRIAAAWLVVVAGAALVLYETFQRQATPALFIVGCIVATLGGVGVIEVKERRDSS